MENLEGEDGPEETAEVEVTNSEVAESLDNIQEAEPDIGETISEEVEIGTELSAPITEAENRPEEPSVSEEAEVITEAPSVTVETVVEETTA